MQRNRRLQCKDQQEEGILHPLHAAPLQIHFTALQTEDTSHHETCWGWVRQPGLLAVQPPVKQPDLPI